jgi:hypothetical protein
VLTRDSDDMIPLSESILSVYQPGQLMTIRGRSGSMYAYDLDNNTFIWTKNLNNAVTITLLDFIDSPNTFRQYVTTRAARIFQEEIIGQVSAETVNRQEEAEAYADLLDDDAERAGLNVAYGTLDMLNTTQIHRKLW